MQRGNGNINDQNYRSRTRNAAEHSPMPEPDKSRGRKIRLVVISVALVLAVALGIRFLGGSGTRAMTASRLPCYANQDVTPFGENILYYDGDKLHCLTGSGTIRWSFPIGSGATFRAGPNSVALWRANQLFLVDKNGNATYNENMEGTVQFVRVGERYVAAAVGEETEPKLYIKDLSGNQVDLETEAFKEMILLDVGFFGNQGEYLWTLAMDVFGTAPNTVMNTFQVGKMNTGEVSLGDKITYKVVYENARLRVFNTQQMYTFDYKGVQDTNASMLVYGWKLIDTDIPERGAAKMLMAPTAQTSSAQEITELRVLEGDTDKRYTLPDTCVGACIWEGNIYAFSGQNHLYRADVNSQKFFVTGIPLADNAQITAFYGVTDDGRALLGAGNSVYSLVLPK